MQLTKTFPPNSAIFIEKKWVENRLWGKSGFLLGKKMYHDLHGCGRVAWPTPGRGARHKIKIMQVPGVYTCRALYTALRSVCNTSVPLQVPTLVPHFNPRPKGDLFRFAETTGLCPCVRYFKVDSINNIRHILHIPSSQESNGHTL